MSQLLGTVKERLSTGDQLGTKIMPTSYSGVGGGERPTEAPMSRAGVLKKQTNKQKDLGKLGVLEIHLGGPRKQNDFIIILRWYLTFMLSFAHKNTVEFSRRYMTYDDIIINGMFDSVSLFDSVSVLLTW